MQFPTSLRVPGGCLAGLVVIISTFVGLDFASRLSGMISGLTGVESGKDSSVVQNPMPRAKDDTTKLAPLPPENFLETANLVEHVRMLITKDAKNEVTPPENLLKRKFTKPQDQAKLVNRGMLGLADNEILSPAPQADANSALQLTSTFASGKIKTPSASASGSFINGSQGGARIDASKPCVPRGGSCSCDERCCGHTIKTYTYRNVLEYKGRYRELVNVEKEFEHVVHGSSKCSGSGINPCWGVDLGTCTGNIEGERCDDNTYCAAGLTCVARDINRVPLEKTCRSPEQIIKEQQAKETWQKNNALRRKKALEREEKKEKEQKALTLALSKKSYMQSFPETAQQLKISPDNLKQLMWARWRKQALIFEAEENALDKYHIELAKREIEKWNKPDKMRERQVACQQGNPSKENPCFAGNLPALVANGFSYNEMLSCRHLFFELFQAHLVNPGEAPNYDKKFRVGFPKVELDENGLLAYAPCDERPCYPLPDGSEAQVEKEIRSGNMCLAMMNRLIRNNLWYPIDDDVWMTDQLAFDTWNLEEGLHTAPWPQGYRIPVNQALGPSKYKCDHVPKCQKAYVPKCSEVLKVDRQNPRDGSMCRNTVCRDVPMCNNTFPPKLQGTFQQTGDTVEGFLSHQRAPECRSFNSKKDKANYDEFYVDGKGSADWYKITLGQVNVRFGFDEFQLSQIGGMGSCADPTGPQYCGELNVAGLPFWTYNYDWGRKLQRYA